MSDLSEKLAAIEATTEWREVPGFPNYRVSTDGEIWSRPRRGRAGGILNPSSVDKDGYRVFQLCRESEIKKWRLHVIVMEAFIGPRPEGLHVRHLNGNPADNRLSNLAYGTPRQNQQDRIAHGRHNDSKTQCVRGHEYTPENTYIYPGQSRRNCRACCRLRHAATYQRRAPITEPTP